VLETPDLFGSRTETHWRVGMLLVVLPVGQDTSVYRIALVLHFTQ
jgi:hypothetical protein